MSVHVRSVARRAACQCGALAVLLLAAVSPAAAQTVSVGNFIKTTAAGPVMQTVPHKLGQAPSALLLWTEGRTDETFSDATAVVFRAAASAGGASGVLTLTISRPAGTVMNDVMIAAIGVDASSPTISAPSGWTLVRQTNNTTTTRNSLAIFQKIAGSSEPASYAFTMSASTGSAGGIMSFSGVDLQDPIDVESGQATASGTTHATPSVTTTATDETIVTMHTFASQRTWTPPTGMTEAVDVASGATGAGGQSIEMNYVVQAAIGATGIKTATAAGNADRGNTEILALRPKYGNHASVGMTDGTSSGSISTSTRNGVATSAAARRAALKALTIVKWDETVVAEADFVSWDGTNFTINWTTNDTEPYVVHFIAIGGPGVLAKVVNWQMATNTGNQSITGVGFKPVGVIHIHANSGLTDMPPSSGPAGGMGFGVMDAAGNQWATSTFSSAANPSDSQRGQQTDATIYTFTNQLGIAKEASFVSMDPDGFTLNYSTANANAGQVFSLVLGGLSFKAGNFNKPTTAAPATQTISGVGFLPYAVFLHSFQDIARTAPVAHARLGYGASDGSSGNSSAFAEQDGVSPTNTQGIDKVTKHFMKVNNANGTIDAEADLTNLNTDGFALKWTTNDNVATQMLYFALAPAAATEVRLLSFDATRYDGGTLLQWRTGYESDNLGFNLYREINGVRTRVNSALIGGSGLLAGRGTAVTGEQSYARWDLDAPSDSVPVYWLEDVDFNGTRTLHGPIVPAAAALNDVVPVVTTSRDLADLRHSARGKVFVRRVEAPAAAPSERGVAAGAAAQRLVAGPVAQRIVAGPAAVQWTLAADAAVKIGIDRTGWYRITQPELVAAGLDPNLDPRTLRLFVEGREVSLRVNGEDDGRFDAVDTIEFYASGADTPYTNVRTYWLAGGSARGLRISRLPRDGSAGGARPSSFWSLVERKDRSVYFAALENGDAENWFGPLVSSDPALLTIDADHLDTAAGDAAQLEVAVQGVTSADSHQVSVLVNGAEIGQLIFRGQTPARQTFAVPAGRLREGSNDVTLVARGGDTDFSLVDVLRLTYRHTYDADADLLRFTADGGAIVNVGSFASPSIRVIDISDLSNAIELAGAITTGGAGSSSVTVHVPGSGPRTLVAFSAPAMFSAASLEANHPSAWHAPSQAYDYVIVSHRSLIDHVAPLAALRAREGYHPAVIDVEDLYDEFSFGDKTPQAIRDFLANANATWRQAPKFVVLVGDATTDPRDYAALGDADLVPTKQVPMGGVSLETASDDWFADFDNTGLPTMAIGRLSVRTTEQADAVVAKIVGYQPNNAESWTKRVLLMADQTDDTSNFERYTDDLSAQVGGGYTVNRVSRDVLGAGGSRDALTRGVNDGQLLVNFSGHGSVQLWGKDGDLLTNADIASGWSNANRLPFIVAMDCLNGLFDQVWDEESLAEALQRAPNAGAVAVWASSSVTSSATQSLVNAELFRLIFSGTYATVGEAVAAAKRVVGNPDLRRSWIFFGDPAMRLAGVPRPSAPPPSGSIKPGLANPVLYGTAFPPGYIPMNGADVRAARAVTPPAAGPAGPAMTSQSAAPVAASIRLENFTGDARADVLAYDAVSGHWALSSGDAARGVKQGVWDAGWQVVAGDLDGDGRSDLIAFKGETSAWIQGITKGDGVFAFTQGAWRDEVEPGAQVLVGDFNGDRRDDLLLYQPGDGRWTLGLSDGRGSFAFRRGTLPSGLRVHAADLDADGISDVFGYDAVSGLGVIARGDKGGTLTPTKSTWGTGWRVTIGHFSGRRAADLLFYDPATGAWRLALNDGQGTFTLHDGRWTTGLELQAADLDGDGHDDLFGYNAATGAWMTAVQESPARFAVDDGSWAPGYVIATGDVTGAGRDQVVALDPASGASFVCTRLSPGVFVFVPQSTPGTLLVGRPR